MAKLLEIYKCEACGNIVEMVHGGNGDLICCGEKMKLMPEQTEDQGKEKHVPVVDKSVNGMKVRVGEVGHPMEEKHYIEWIEVVSGDKAYRKFLHPGEKPEAEFFLFEGDYVVREYCNIHGLWRSK